MAEYEKKNQGEKSLMDLNHNNVCPGISFELLWLYFSLTKHKSSDGWHIVGEKVPSLVIALGHFTWRENALDLLLLKKDRKKHSFLCPMWATEKQERTWVSVGKKVYSSISNSNYCIYPLPSNYIVHKYLAKSQKYDTYCSYNSLYLFLSFDESVG